MGQRILLGLVAILLAACEHKKETITITSTPPPSLTIPTPTPTATPEPPKTPIIEAPVSEPIIPEARQLIIEFEGFDHRPAWPEGSSGVTIGVGYDCGYYAKSIIERDWNDLQANDRERLSSTSGITGRKAQSRISGLRDIYINTEVGQHVFDNVDVPREFDNCRRAFKGFENLKPSAQGALISLGYNRGYGMSGDSRREMRAIRDLVPKKDYAGMANELRKMKRLWRGTSIETGMDRRREAEARLMEHE